MTLSEFQIPHGKTACAVHQDFLPDDAHGMLQCVVMSDYVTLNNVPKTDVGKILALTALLFCETLLDCIIRISKMFVRLTYAGNIGQMDL